MKLKKLIEDLRDRQEMPQIHSNQLSTAIGKMEAVGIKASASRVPLKSLRPLQKTVNKPKVLELKQAYKAKSTIAPIVISEDNFIVDGHHRWLGMLSAGKLDELVVKIGLKKEQALQVYSKLSENV